MLTQLSTLKKRLGLDLFNVTFDELLNNAINALSERFDRECCRTFARTIGLAEEFPADDLELVLGCYPVETVSKFELKSTEAEGWVEQAGIDYILRRKCTVSLSQSLGTRYQLARITYTGGCVLPGTTPGAGQTALPTDIEQAVVEQLAYWYNNKEKFGLVRTVPRQGVNQQLATIDLLPQVKATLAQHTCYRI